MGFGVQSHVGLWTNLNSNCPSLGFLDFIQDATLSNCAACVLIPWPCRTDGVVLSRFLQLIKQLIRSLHLHRSYCKAITSMTLWDLATALDQRSSKLPLLKLQCIQPVPVWTTAVTGWLSLSWTHREHHLGHSWCVFRMSHLCLKAFLCQTWWRPPCPVTFSGYS